MNYANSDVDPGQSRNAALDGMSLPTPSSTAQYVLHDTLVGAVGALSPGLRIDGSPF